MNLEYSQVKKWFTSYVIYKNDSEGKNMLISGEIEKQTQEAFNLDNRKLSLIIGYSLFLVFLICAYWYIWGD